MLKESFELISYSEKTPAILTTSEGRVLSVNLAAKRLGFDKNMELLEKLGADFREFMEICSGSRESFFSRKEITLPDGSSKDYRFEGAGISSGDERGLIFRLKSIEKSLIGFSKTNKADRLFRERALSEQRLQTVIDAAIDVIILADAYGKIILANKAVEKVLGYSIDEVVGQNVKILMPSAFSVEHDQYMQNYRQTNNAKIIGIGREVVAKRKDGSELPINLSIGESRFANELYYTGIIHDLTGYKEIENKLQQSHKMEALGKLSGGVAHDFNNLLAVVIGRLEFAADLVQEKRTLEHLGIALNAADKGAKLIDQLLSFSRQKHLNNEILNLSEEVNDIVEMLGRVLGEQIEITTEISDKVIKAYADTVQLNNALINLATNSRDAMMKGGSLKITVEPSRYYEEQEGNFVKVSLSDTGIGMPPETLNQAVEPFFTTKDVGMGTGLGLSMVHGYMRQSDGFLTIESIPDAGTTVSLFFRAVD